MDEELEAVCQEITRRQTVITGYKEEYARLKGRKICPGCGESIDRSAAYCPKCGAVCWEDEEPEENCGEMQAEPAAGEDITAQAEDSEADEGSKETEKLQFAEEVPLEEEHLSPVQEAGGTAGKQRIRIPESSRFQSVFVRKKKKIKKVQIFSEKLLLTFALQ